MEPFTSILLVIGLVLAVAPTYALEEIAALPTINIPRSARQDVYAVINGTPLWVAQAVFSGDRQHFGFGDLTTGSLVEVVRIGPQLYYRMNAETRWKLTTPDNVQFPPEFLFAEPYVGTRGARFFHMDEVAINGTQTTRYHIEFDPQNLRGTDTYVAGDIFVGKADRYIYKNQLKVQGVDPQDGPVTFEWYTVSRDFDRSVEINPPPADLVDIEASRITLPVEYFLLQQAR